MMKAKKYIQKWSISLFLLCGLLSACTEIEYKEIENPAYIRVFNNLNYEIQLDNRFEKAPFLTMLIDPVFDADSIPVSAAIVGDFLDKRDKYAAPYPVHSASSTSKKNPEYPGKENVLVGPILNGFDLSSWAQITAGKHRVVFMYRPLNDVPFFELDARNKKNIAIDQQIELTPKEVYTMHVVQKDYTTKENVLILRQENFTKLSFADSLVYVNFYNMSAKGFRESDDLLKPNTDNGYRTLRYGIANEMNVYLSLFSGLPINVDKPISGYKGLYLTTMERNTENNSVSPYASFPLFPAAGSTGTIHTNMVEVISLIAPGLDFQVSVNSSYDPPKGLAASLTFSGDGTENTGVAFFPNMIINTHSGIYNPRSFSSVNTVEFVNGEAYLTTIQRKYDPPIYK